MDLNIVKKRMNQVFMVDSINSTEADFLATHIPFKKISFRYGISGSVLETVDEEEAFYKLFKDPSVEDKHQLIIVEGSSGSGKSHFIRWINANLISDYSGTDEILLIRRSDNTLKGTIKQLLTIDAVKNLKNRDIYERLVRANNTISEKKFKDEIYYKFIVETENSDDELLSSVEKKRLSALLSDASFKEKLLHFNGPIERIFSKISSTSVTGSDVAALFTDADFTIDADFYDSLKDTGSKDAQRIAKNLIDDGVDEDLLQRIVVFMNSKVDIVIQNCAGIEPGDFKQIFKEIRQELKKAGKNLILLIEDITACIGIDQALLDALIMQHTGSDVQDNMCKLVSVIGTTSEYYRSFRDNYKDRITTQITIEDGCLGQNRYDLYLFFAKYLNAISIDEEVIEDWYKNQGANPDKMPVADSSSSWESISFNSLNISLYPFTKKAINSLYDNMEEHKTPRYILREIIEPVINELVSDKNRIFYYLRTKNNPLNDNKITRLNKTIDEMEVSSDKDIYKERAISFIGFYGNGEITKIGKKIIGIEKNLFIEFGFGELWDKLEETVVSGTEDVVDDLNDGGENTTYDPPVVKNTKYINFKKQLDDWHEKKQIFVNPRSLLEELHKIIYSSINWQQNGIQNQRIDMLKDSSIKLLSFERQEKSEDSSILKLPDTDETYDLLRAVGQWLFIGNKSWNFPESHDAIYIITSWIEKYKDAIIKGLKKQDDSKIPTYIKVAIVNELYRRVFNGYLDLDKLSQLSINDLAIEFSKNTRTESFGRKWNELCHLINEEDGKLSYDTVRNYFNITQGSGTSKVFFDYYEFEKAIKEVKKDGFNYDDKLYKSLFKVETQLFDFYKEIKKRIKEVMDEQSEINSKIISSIYAKMGWDSSFDIDSGDLKYFLNDISDFYEKCELIGTPIVIPTIKITNFSSQISEISRNLGNIKAIDYNQNLECLHKISKINYNLLKEFVDLSNKLENDYNSVSSLVDTEYDKLVRSGSGIERDPRFDSNKNLYELLKSEMEEYL